jgi:hypothetical protein
MSYRTLEVQLENGVIHPRSGESLPTKANALLTLLDGNGSASATTCGELAEMWGRIEKLSPQEANAFANDLERARASLPPLKTKWD